jgi:phospholipid transport system substrate-binding protein
MTSKNLVSRRATLGLALAALVATPRRGWALDAVATPVQALDEGLLAVMRAGRHTSFRDRFHLLEPTIDSVFDLPGILRISVGPRWSEIDPTQQAALMKVFRCYTVASYVANFDNYAGEQFDIAPATRAIGTDQVVSTTMVPRSGDKIRIDYVMRQDAATWKVVDVLLDGTISRVAVQRSDFRGTLTHGGVPALIASLERKVRDMAGNALES